MLFTKALWLAITICRIKCGISLSWWQYYLLNLQYGCKDTNTESLYPKTAGNPRLLSCCSRIQKTGLQKCKDTRKEHSCVMSTSLCFHLIVIWHFSASDNISLPKNKWELLVPIMLSIQGSGCWNLWFKQHIVCVSHLLSGKFKQGKMLCKLGNHNSYC